jgi:hypothetical protein
MQRTYLDFARPGFGTRQLGAVVERILLWVKVPDPRARPRSLGWGAAALRFGCRCARLSSFAFLAAASAQSFLAPPLLDFSGTNQNTQLQQGGPTGASALSAPPTAPLAGQPLPLWGPVVFRPHLMYRFLYGDGIPAQANEKVKTAINEVYPGILFEVGNHWRLDYTPSLHYYSSGLFRNTTDESVSLNGATTYENWTLGLSQGYATTSQPLIETGIQTDLEDYSTALNAAYSFNAKTSLEMGLNQAFQFVGQNGSSEQLVDSRVWSTVDWLNYEVWPRFRAGLGVGGGYVDLSAGSSMFYEQPQGRIIWQATEKLGFSASGGLDDRQFGNSTRPDLLNPIFTVSGFYSPFEATTLSLNASRMVSPSDLEGLISESTGVSGTFHQRFVKKLNLDVTAGYGETYYELTSAGPNQARTDDYTFVNVRLSMAFLKRGTVGVLYQASKNTSTVSNYHLSSTQVGFDLGYRY